MCELNYKRVRRKNTVLVYTNVEWQLKAIIDGHRSKYLGYNPPGLF